MLSLTHAIKERKDTTTNTSRAIGDLATVELQLIMHYLNQQEFCRLARCSKTMFQVATQRFAVKYLTPLIMLPHEYGCIRWSRCVLIALRIHRLPLCISFSADGFWCAHCRRWSAEDKTNAFAHLFTQEHID